jgi:hypothetical protein
MEIVTRPLIVEPINSVNLGAVIPMFEYASNGDDAKLDWKITPPSPGSGYEYRAGLFNNQTFPSGSARRVTFAELMALAAVSPDATGLFTFAVPASVHGNPPYDTPAEFVFVVTRFDTANSSHRVVASCTINIRKAQSDSKA